MSIPFSLSSVFATSASPVLSIFSHFCFTNRIICRFASAASSDCLDGILIFADTFFVQVRPRRVLGAVT
jgi:hypothetical protein